MGLFDSVLDDLKGLMNDSLKGVETRAHQYITEEQKHVVDAARLALMASAGYALMYAAVLPPKYTACTVFLAPLTYLLSAKAIAGREGVVLGLGVAAAVASELQWTVPDIVPELPPVE